MSDGDDDDDGDKDLHSDSSLFERLIRTGVINKALLLAPSADDVLTKIKPKFELNKIKQIL